MIKVVGLVGKKTIDSKKANHRYIKDLVAFLEKKGIKILIDHNIGKIIKKDVCSNEQILKKANLVITLGGDGTLLKTARNLHRYKVMILGINFGTLGFLTETAPDKMLEVLEKVLNGNYFIDRRSLLRVTVYRDGKKIATSLALNDAVINQGAYARLLKMDIEFDKVKVVKLKGDGLIVATPTGSTGHALSAGGPIVHPKLEGLVITPICPTSMSLRPIVIPHDRQLIVTVDTRRAENSPDIGLTIDGQDTVALKYGDKVKFRRSKRYLHLVRIKNKYYKILRQKLHWGTKI